MSENIEKLKIAVTYEDGKVYGHFGHTERFKVYDVRDGKVQSSEVLDTAGSGHCALAEFLQKGGVDALICGGIGAGAKNALAEAGIRLYGGVTGETDKAVADLLANKLNYDSEAECNHHHEHGHGHEQGHHHHGGHGCHENCAGHGH